VTDTGYCITEYYNFLYFSKDFITKKGAVVGVIVW